MKFLLSELDVVFANELPALERFNITRPEELGRYARHVVELVENFVSPYRITAINLRIHHGDALSRMPLSEVWESLSRRKPESVSAHGAFGFFDAPGAWRNDAEIEVDFSWFLVARLEDGSFVDRKIHAHRVHLSVSRPDRKHFRAVLDDGWEIAVPGEAPTGVHRFLLQDINEGLYAYGVGSRRRDIICESTGLLNRLVPGFDNLWLATVDAKKLFPRVERWTLKPFAGFGYLLPGLRNLETAFRSGAFFQPEKGSDFYLTNRSRLAVNISYGANRAREAVHILKSHPGLHQDERLVREIECEIPAPKKDCFGRARLSISFENPNGDKAGLTEKIYVVNPDSAPAVSFDGTPGQEGLENRLLLSSASLPILKSGGPGLQIMYFQDMDRADRASAENLFLCSDKGPRPIMAPGFESLEVGHEGGWAPGIVMPRAVPGPLAPAREDAAQVLTPPLMYHYMHNGVRYSVAQRFRYRQSQP